MKYFITGAGGFIGAWIVKELIERGTPVVAFDTAPDTRRLELIVPRPAIASVQFLEGDVRDLELLTAALKKEKITHIVHLAGVQVPTCRRDPVLGASVNVIGTLNVFEAVKRLNGSGAGAATGAIQGLVYASSAAVMGPEESYGSGPVANDAVLLPRTHYGVFKQCNEGNARVYSIEDGISSIGLRPYTVYGPGRDVGVTADVTKAMKAVVAGRPFHIRFGGRNDLQYVRDTARAFIRCAEAAAGGARAYNLQGSVVRVAQEFIPLLEEVYPAARGRVTCTDVQLPIAPELDDSAIQSEVGAIPKTPLRDGIAETIAVFERLKSEGRLDLSELDA